MGLLGLGVFRSLGAAVADPAEADLPDLTEAPRALGRLSQHRRSKSLVFLGNKKKFVMTYEEFGI